MPSSEIDPPAPGVHAWLAPDGALVAVGEMEGEAGRVKRGFFP